MRISFLSLKKHLEKSLFSLKIYIVSKQNPKGKIVTTQPFFTIEISSFSLLQVRKTS